MRESEGKAKAPRVEFEDVILPITNEFDFFSLCISMEAWRFLTK